MGLAEVHLLTEKPLDFCCLLRKIFKMEYLPLMLISRCPARLDNHLKFPNAEILLVPKLWSLPQPGGWHRLDSLSVKTS